VVWAALVNRGTGGSAVRYAVSAAGRAFSGARTVAAVGSNAGATPRIAALRGGTVAVILRDTRPLHTTGVLRYARRVGAALGAPSTVDAGGFSQTSPTPAWLRSAPLMLFTRQIASGLGVQAQAVAADPATGDATLLADAGSIVTPAVAHSGDGLVVAWAGQGGGIAVSIDR
jgi:hypothetical protein